MTAKILRVLLVLHLRPATRILLATRNCFGASPFQPLHSPHCCDWLWPWVKQTGRASLATDPVSAPPVLQKREKSVIVVGINEKEMEFGGKWRIHSVDWRGLGP